jgi:serine/threonine protein kinase
MLWPRLAYDIGRRFPMTGPRTKPPSVPDHELLRQIGRGSYGEVWLARNVMGTFRAIKVVYRDSFDSDRPYEREFGGLQKFEPVSRTHPGLVNILHVGRNVEAGYFYCVMEVADDLSDGQAIRPELYQARSLASEIGRRGRLPFAECVGLGVALADALHHLHSRGLVHRDIKPSNIIFANGVPKLADIGLVTQIGSQATFVGTEGYLAPEGPGTPAADLYSLGRLLYEISFGKSQDQFPDLPTRLREFPDAGQLMRLNSLILKGCDPQPARRFQSAEDFRAALAALGGRSVGPESPSARGTPCGAAGSKVVILSQAFPESDSDFATRLAGRLRAEGLVVFVDRQDELSVDWARQVESEIRDAHLVVAVLSQTSVQSDLMAYALEIARQASGRPNRTPKIITLDLSLPDALPLPVALALEGAIRVSAPGDPTAILEAAADAVRSALTTATAAASEQH